jgi:glycosyltransferase involved in cell wall biosynthesis
LGLQTKVRFFDNIPLTQIAEVIANADIGVVPKRADSFGNEAYSTKILEFMSQGIPVVASRTKIDAFYFNDDVVKFFESGNADDLARKILEVVHDAQLRASVIEKAREYVRQNNWQTKKKEYLQLVDTLSALERNGRATLPSPTDEVVNAEAASVALRQ